MANLGAAVAATLTVLILVEEVAAPALRPVNDGMDTEAEVVTAAIARRRYEDR